MPDHQTAWIAAMRCGDYATAWAISDAVLAGRDPRERDQPLVPYHHRWVWDGRPFRGRHVLVRCYHGLGDTLQFARYLEPLRQFVASVTVEAQAELVPLLATAPGIDRLVAFRPAAPLDAAECDFEIMELAHALRLPPEAVPPLTLRVPRASPPPGAIGLCWAAGGWDRERSAPPALLTPLVRLLPCVSLQQGRSPLPVGNPAGCPADIAGTAGLIAGLGLVVTVDTMVAHLAGTLNRPCWLLLKHDADWRWMTGRSDSPWYPSMRLFRQPSPGDWSTVLARVEAEAGRAASAMAGSS